MKKTVLQFNSGRLIARGSFGEKIINEGIDFSISEGEKLALVGKTGSGKTMTALQIMGLLPDNIYSEGSRIVLKDTKVDGEEAYKEKSSEKNSEFILGKDVVYIPQIASDYLNPSRKVKKQFYDGLKKLGVKKELWKSVAIEKMKLAGLDNPEDFLERYPFQLSGGQNQKLTIAMAACADPLLLIADEPTNGLDEASAKNFTDMLDSIFPESAKLIITHDSKLAAVCDRIYELKSK